MKNPRVVKYFQPLDRGGIIQERCESLISGSVGILSQSSDQLVERHCKYFGEVLLQKSGTLELRDFRALRDLTCWCIGQMLKCRRSEYVATVLELQNSGKNLRM
jgi:hypothetical protein